MKILMTLVTGPTDAVGRQTIDLSRVPVLGEYIRRGEEWYEVKRVAHLSDATDVSAEVYVNPIVDPAREPLRLSEWMASAP
jgi:hypothetical protein